MKCTVLKNRSRRMQTLPGAVGTGRSRSSLVGLGALLALCVVLSLGQAVRGSVRGGKQSTRLILICDRPAPPVSDIELASTLEVLRRRLARVGLPSAGVEMDAANRSRFVLTLPAGSDVERIKD